MMHIGHTDWLVHLQLMKDFINPVKSEHTHQHSVD